MTAHEGPRRPVGPLVIDTAYVGLPDLAHGGYVAGLLTGALGAESSRVRLRRPVPPAQALRLERPRSGEVELHGDAGLLADGVAADVLIDLPAPVAPTEARAAARRFLRRARHPFPYCLACGPAHPRGLRVFPGPVAGRSLVAALWVPPVALAGAGGDLPPELVAAALDCPQLWALILHAPPESTDRVVTAMLETRLEQRILVGEPHVVMGWPIGRDGRRWLAGAAILRADGSLCAAGRQTAAVVAGWGVPLGRDPADGVAVG